MGIKEKYTWQDDANATHSRAEHVRLGRTVAVRRIPLDGLGEKQRQAVLQISSRIAELDHPVIPQLLDFASEHDAFFLFTEYFPAPQQPLASDPFQRVCELERICDGLAYAEERGIVHGLLSEDSLLADEQGDVKVSGLGERQLELARVRGLTEVPEADGELVQLAQWLQLQLTRGGQDGNGHVLQKLESSSRRRLEEVLKAGCQNNVPSIRAFHIRLREWVNEENERRESERLQFGAKPIGDRVTPPRRIRPSMVLAVGAGVVALLLVAAGIWANKDGRGSSPADRAKSGEFGRI